MGRGDFPNGQCRGAGARGLGPKSGERLGHLAFLQQSSGALGQHSTGAQGIAGDPFGPELLRDLQGERPELHPWRRYSSHRRTDCQSGQPCCPY